MVNGDNKGMLLKHKDFPRGGLLLLPLHTSLPQILIQLNPTVSFNHKILLWSDKMSSPPNKKQELPCSKTQENNKKSDNASSPGDTTQKDEKVSFQMPRQATPKRKVDAKDNQNSSTGTTDIEDQQNKSAQEEPGRDDVGGAAGRAMGSFMADVERSGYRG